MATIASLAAKEILDSRGNPTLEVTCALASGSLGTASVPSGASTGIHEALELRDGNAARYGGLGVLKAIQNVEEEIFEHVRDKDLDQTLLDKALIALDGTENKSRLGANAILGVSLAFARAYAEEQHVPLYEYIGGLAGNTEFKLPQPMFNIINGGAHADSGLDIQEFMLAPTGFPTFRKKVQVATEVIATLKKIIGARGYTLTVGDEGGFAPKLASNEEALDCIVEAVQDAGYSSTQIQIGIDVASSGLYKDGAYTLRCAKKEETKTTAEMIAWYETLLEKYPIIFIEDGLSEDDWEGFREMTQKIGSKVKIVGDDLTVTNTKRIQAAIKNNAVNAVLIKLNQIGTLTETVEAIQITKKQGWIPFVSHRSGETMDTFIADLAVGLSCDYIKAGSPTRSERICKYNRLIEIEDTVGGA
ncbi:MAG: phosphopyruvate hydratase [Patescibacteria group bacterium]